MLYALLIACKCSLLPACVLRIYAFPSMMIKIRSLISHSRWQKTHHPCALFSKNASLFFQCCIASFRALYWGCFWSLASAVTSDFCVPSLIWLHPSPLSRSPHVCPGADLVVLDEGHRLRNISSAITTALCTIRTLRRVRMATRFGFDCVSSVSVAVRCFQLLSSCCPPILSDLR